MVSLRHVSFYFFGTLDLEFYSWHGFYHYSVLEPQHAVQDEA